MLPVTSPFRPCKAASGLERGPSRRCWPWRFDVKIPAGARRINLVATDAESRSPYDLANWVEAGFVLNSAKS